MKNQVNTPCQKLNFKKPMQAALILIALSLMTSLPNYMMAQDGALDATFNAGNPDIEPSNSYITATAIQSDGKIIIGGNFTSYDGTARNNIARLNSDGSLDNSFDPGTGVGSSITSIVLQSDEKIIIGGYFTSYNGASINFIARLNTDGSLDTSFDPGNGPNSSVYTIAIQSDNKIIIGGAFVNYDGTSRTRIARLNSDGSLDTTFDPGTGADSPVYTITVQSDEKIFIGGYFSTYNGTTRNAIARLDADGSLDTTFDPGTGANSPVLSSALQTDGKLLIGGDFTDYNGTGRNKIARLNTDGSLDTAFDPGTGANNQVSDIFFQDDGKIIVAGHFTTYNGTGRNRIARLNTDGSLDTAFDPGTGATSSINSVSLQSDGNIILGGFFDSYDGTGRNRIARVVNSIEETVDIESGLVGHWKFNNNFNDETANANNGTGVNGIGFNCDQGGNANQALNPDGSDDYVTVADNTSLRPANITITCWAEKTNTTNILEHFVAKAIGSGHFDSYAVWIENNLLSAAISDNSGFATILQTSWTAISDGWHFISFTFDDASGDLKLYIDGIQIDAANTTKSIEYDTHALLLGADNDAECGSCYYLSRRMDNVRIYDRALTNDDLNALYTLENQVPTTCIPDADNDTYLSDVDCNDNNNAVNPGATETCNTIDDNCDGNVDENLTCPVDLTTDLIAYYPFNNNSNDEVGNLDGTPSNGAMLTTDRYCNANQAFEFDGENDFIDFSGPPTTQTDNYTLSAWVNPDVINDEGIAVMVGFDNCSSGNGYSMGIGVPFGAGSGFQGLLSNIAFMPSGANFTAPGQWYHIVMLRDNGVNKFYLNGVQTSSTYTSAPYVPTGFRIGGQNGCRFWDGKVDDVRIYGRAFDAEQVLGLYNFELGGCDLVDEDMDTYLNDVDCDDNNVAVNPGATEICNAIDDDCDGFIDGVVGCQDTIQSAQTGDWSSSSTWVGNVVPGNGDVVEILLDHMVTTTEGLNFENFNSLDISGTLVLNANATLGGTIVLDGELYINSLTSINTGLSMTGNGTINNANILNVISDFTFTIPTINNYYSISGSGKKTYASGVTVNLYSGLTGTGEHEFALGSILNINGGYIYHTTLRNHGTLNWLSGDINLDCATYGLNFFNDTTGVININTPDERHWSNSHITNNGTIHKNNSVITYFDNFHAWNCTQGTGSFTNGSTGIFNIPAGSTVSYNNGATLGGTINLDGVININSATSLASGLGLAGTGVVNINNYLTVPFDYTFTIPTINDNYSITGVGKKTYASGVTVNLTNGLTGTGEHVFEQGSILNINGGYIYATTLRNLGTINWLSGDINLDCAIYGLNLFNDTTGVININTNDDRHWYHAHIINNGTFHKNTSGITYFDNYHLWNCGNGTGSFNNSNGTLSGIGTYQFNNGFINTGTISPGSSPGDLSIGFADVPNGTLSIELASTAGPGTGHDRLNVTGNYIAGGTLNVSLLGGYDPHVGTVYEIVSATGTVTGSFSTLNLPGGNAAWDITYGSQNITLTALCVQNLYYGDSDGDGYGNPTVLECDVTAPLGFVADNTDCNDAFDSIYPGAPETCNTIDDDCDGTVDDDFIYYSDADEDGYGTGTGSISCSDPGNLFSQVDGDCDDDDDSVNPGITEICNYLDDDCDGLFNEDITGCPVVSATTGDWNTGSTWIGGFIPTSTSVVLIQSGHIVTLSDTRSCESVTVNAGGTLRLAGGTITTTSPSSIPGSLHFQNGTINGSPFTLEIGSISLFDGLCGFNAKVINTDLINYGTITWIAGALTGTGGSLINHGTISIEETPVESCQSPYYLVPLENYGTFTMNNSAGFGFPTNSVFHPGSITYINYSVSTSGNGSYGGTIYIASGAVFTVQYWDNHFYDTHFIGGGTLRLQPTNAGSNNVHFHGTNIIDVAYFESMNNVLYYYTSIIIYDQSTVTLGSNNTFSFWGGSLSGPGVFNISEGAVLSLQGAPYWSWGAPSFSSDLTINNYGTINDADVSIGAYVTINNYATMNLSSQHFGNTTAQASFAVTLTNYGTLNISGSGECMMIGPFIQTLTGNINITGGTVWSIIGTTNWLGGVIDIGAGSTMNCISGNHYFTGSTVINGSGNVSFSHAWAGTCVPHFNGSIILECTMTINVESVYDGPSLINNGTVTGTFPLRFGGISGQQTLGGNGNILNTCILDNPDGLDVTGSQNVSGNLSFVNGKITLHDGDLRVEAVTGTGNSRYVATTGLGSLLIDAVSSSPVLFPIGHSTNSYSPVTMSNEGTVTTLGARVRSGFDPGTPLINLAPVNLEWTLSNPEAVVTDIDLTVNWNHPVDESPAFDPAIVHLSKWNGSAWNSYTPQDISGGCICSLSENIGADLGISTKFLVANDCTPVDYYQDSDNDNHGNLNTIVSSCYQPVGFVANHDDCNDTEGTIHPEATEICNSNTDDDCDGLADDADPGVTGQNTYFADNDDDSFGAGIEILSCILSAHRSTNDDDCDDTEGAINPDAQEICNAGIDDDCDGFTDNDDPGITGQDTYFTDTDGDTYGVGAVILSCTQLSNTSTNDDDCDDGDVAVNPAATEICNGDTDDDCDGLADDADPGITGQTSYYADNDHDNYGAGAVIISCTQPDNSVTNNLDCLDADPGIFPGSIEVCNGLDDDCDSSYDEGVTNTYYMDGDGDGYGAGSAIQACTQQANTVTNNLDCLDADPSIFPGSIEVCNGLDDDCDSSYDEGVTNTYYTDGDGDGYGAGLAIQACTQQANTVTNNLDCLDADPSIFPGSVEVCNGLDDDCDSSYDEGFATTTYYRDFDGDGKGNPAVSIQSCFQPVGYVTNSNDCDDNSTTACPKPSGMSSSNITDVSATVSWGNLVCATKYRLEYRRKTPPISAWTIVYTTSPSFNITGLTGPNIQYQWRVATICSPNGTAAESGYAAPVQSFYTNYRVYTDADSDGQGANGSAISYVNPYPQPGYSINNYDCDDAVSTTYFLAPELCNGVDDDCDLIVDEGANWYQDSDNDGLGNPASSQNACLQPSGYVSNSLDCNDNSSAAVCSQASNVVASTVGFSSATITWTGASCVSGYTLMYRATNPVGAFSTQFNTNGNTVTFTGLLPNTTYQYRIRSKCPSPNPATTSAWAYYTFTTLPLPMGLQESGDSEMTLADPAYMQFDVFPNPGDGFFYIRFTGDIEVTFDMDVTDPFGKQVFAGKWSVFEGQTIDQLDLMWLPGGVYQIRLQAGELMLTKKIVIVR